MTLNVIYSVLELLIGIGVFLFSIILLGRVFGRPTPKLTKMFEKANKNRVSNMGLGIGVTMITQSSTPTTVILISLVGASIISLWQAAAMIMGINIGSSLTSLIFIFTTFRIRYFIMFLVFAGATIKIITKNESWNRGADMMIAFGLLFVGMMLMSSALSTNEIIVSFFQNLFETIRNPLVLILIGTIFSFLIQSSSAAIGISVAMVGSGLLPFESAIYIVLSANLGTSFTAILASLSCNRQGKRIALVHVIFNFLGLLFFLAVLLPMHSILVPWYQSLIYNEVIQISVFHLVFNVVTMLILLPFARQIMNLTTMIIKVKPNEACEKCDVIPR